MKYLINKEIEEWRGSNDSDQPLFQAMVFVEGYGYHTVETLLGVVDAVLAGHEGCLGSTQFLSADASLDIRAKVMNDFRS